MNRLKLFSACYAAMLLPGFARVASAETQPPTWSARGLLERLLPRHAKHFVLEIIPRDPAGDVFEIESREGRIVLRGNNGVPIASALNWYLRHTAAVITRSPAAARCNCQVRSAPGGSDVV